MPASLCLHFWGSFVEFLSWVSPLETGHISRAHPIYTTSQYSKDDSGLDNIDIVCSAKSILSNDFIIHESTPLINSIQNLTST